MASIKSVVSILILWFISLQVHAITTDMETACTAEGVPLLLCDVSSLTNDFNTATELASWQQRYIVEASPSQINILDMNSSPGGLDFSPTQGFWYFQNSGPLLFKTIDTDFILTTSLTAASSANNAVGSALDFNSGGLMIRDPASSGGNQNYVMFDIGNQQTGQGSLTRNTIDSVSNNIYATGSFSGLLRLCRVGSTISLWRQLTSDADWILSNTYNRADFPNEVQVGLVVNAYQGPSDMTVNFDYVDFQVPSPGNDCSTAPGTDPGATANTELNSDPNFSDDFNSDSLSDWSLLHIIESRPAQYSLLDINTSSAGQLSLTPTNTAWYNNDDAPFIFKPVTGNFVVETTVTAFGLTDPLTGPQSDYNNAGLMIRNPQSILENWVMLDLGRQAATIASMAKVTQDSVSTLNTQPSDITASLRICRVDNTFLLYRRLAAETQWTNIDTIIHNSIPDLVQVGLMSNAWSAPVDIRAEFDYVYLAPVNNTSDCTLPINNDQLASLSDEFDNAASLVDWSIRSVVENDVPHHDLIEIETTTSGFLTIDPNTYVQPGLIDSGAIDGPGWYKDRKGPFVFKEVTGDFSVMTYVRVGTTVGILDNPGGAFQAGGILARDPAGYDVADPLALGNENWIAYNLGNQNIPTATELKTTFADGTPGAGIESDSTMFITPVGTLQSRMIMCRVGDRFRFYRNPLAVGGSWTEELILGEPLINGANLIAPYYNGPGFTRPGMPATLQVGLMANRYYTGGAPVRFEYDYMRFARPGSVDDCVNSVTINLP